MFSYKELIIVVSVLFVLVGKCWCICDFDVYVPPTGTIHSPNYPRLYNNNTNCIWHIHSRETKGAILLSVEDLDIEVDDPEVCSPHMTIPCCKHNWMSIPMSGAGKVKTQQVCGQRFSAKPILVQATDVAVKLHISRFQSGGRGFRIDYRIVVPQECTRSGMVPCGPREEDGCYHNVTQRCDDTTDCVTGLDEADCDLCQFSCHDEPLNCYSLRQKCDGKPDCHDFSDEIDCGTCPKGKARCSVPTRHCFHPSSQRCNGRFECPWGEDEAGCVPGCERKIACSGGEGCYTPAQRCDSLNDCLDGSDETLCPKELCAMMRDHRQCRNGRCLPNALWCDGVNDCGDNSDEQNCLKNSVIAMAIMGSLLCGLLLVVAVGCAFRFYGHRTSSSSSSNYHLHISPHLASRLRMTSSLSLPTLMADELFHREPPPAYSVVVGEGEATVVPVPATRPRRMRRTRLRPVPPPQVVVKPPDSPPPEETSSSQSSPSRGSTSSYLSGTDDTLLLSS